MGLGGQSLRLAAIVFTDIVGYSAVINRNAVLGAKLLDRQRSVVRKCVPLHGGREIETAGDSFLLEFPSALKALECIADIQRRLVEVNQPFPEAERVQIRASIHLGDVEHRGKEVFGDGVNVAARILGLSPEGGVAYSDAVHQQVRNRVEVSATSIGSPSLKNIAHPIEIFTLDADALATIRATEIPKVDAPPQRSRTIWLPVVGLVSCAVTVALMLWLRPPAVVQAAQEIPEHSIAVLPFTNLSRDANNAYFADGMQDEILTALAKISSLKVISRTSVERYRGKAVDPAQIAKNLAVATMLEGSVQSAGNKLRINVQLIDTKTGAHRWAQSYDKNDEDLFTAQSQISQDVARALSANLLPNESRALATPVTKNAKAYDLYLQALEHERFAFDPMSRMAKEVPRAIMLVEQALQEDPSFALAASFLGGLHLDLYHFGVDPTNTRLAAAKSALDRALAIDPDLPHAHFNLGMYHYWGFRDYLRALQELEICRPSMPNDASLYGDIGAIQRRRGNWQEAIAATAKASEIEPSDYYWFSQLGDTYSVMRQWPQAEAAFTKAFSVSLSPADEAVERAFVSVRSKGDLAPLRSALAALPQDPASLADNVGDIYALHWWAREYQSAAASVSAADWVRLAGMPPLPGKLLAARALIAEKKPAEAIPLLAQAVAQLQKRLTEGGDEGETSAHIGLALAYVALDQPEKAVEEGEHAVAMRPVARDAVDGPAYLALLAKVYVKANRRDRALDVLEQLMSLPAGTVVSAGTLALDPDWDALREEPRFKALLHAAGT